MIVLIWRVPTFPPKMEAIEIRNILSSNVIFIYYTNQELKVSEDFGGNRPVEATASGGPFSLLCCLHDAFLAFLCIQIIDSVVSWSLLSRFSSFIFLYIWKRRLTFRTARVLTTVACVCVWCTVCPCKACVNRWTRGPRLGLGWTTTSDPWIYYNGLVSASEHEILH